MKLTFTPEQSAYLNHYINQLRLVAAKAQGADNILRTATKMKAKFAGAPTLVFLGGKERKLLAEMLAYRAGNIQQGDEAAIVAAILEVLK